MTRAAAVAVQQQNSRKHQPQQLRQPYQVTQWSDSGKPLVREGSDENDAVFIAYSAFEKLRVLLQRSWVLASSKSNTG